MLIQNGLLLIFPLSTCPTSLAKHGLFLLGSISLLITSCGLDSNSREPATSPRALLTQSSEFIEPATVSATRVSTFTPIPTSTQKPTLAPTVRPSPSSKPDPSSIAEEKERLAFMMYETNGGCSLPCFWGFTPGETLWADAEGVLETVADVVPPLPGLEAPYQVYVDLEDDISPETIFFQNYFVEADVIVTIDAILPPTPPYSLAMILANFGTPAGAYLNTKVERPVFLLVLYYPDKGMIFSSNSPAEIVDGQVRGCPGEFTSATIAVMHPEPMLSFEEFRSQTFLFSGSDSLENYPDYLSLVDASDLTTDELSELFSGEANGGCIESPIELWPGTDGWEYWQANTSLQWTSCARGLAGSLNQVGPGQIILVPGSARR